MKPRKIALYACLLAGIVLTVAGIAQQSFMQAPAAFATPLLANNPGSQSVSNGIPEPEPAEGVL